MSEKDKGNVWFRSDDHLGHAGICKFLRSDGVTKLRPWDDPEEMNEAFIKKHNEVVKPNDRVNFLGDVVINRRYLHLLHRLNGRKRLIMGNHDIFNFKEYAEYFDDIRGIHVMSDMVLTHVPLAPECVSQRWRMNVHGHLHANSMNSPIHICVCMEQLDDWYPMEYSVLQKRILDQWDEYRYTRPEKKERT